MRPNGNTLYISRDGRCEREIVRIGAGRGSVANFDHYLRVRPCPSRIQRRCNERESIFFFVLRIKHIEAVVPFEQDAMNEIAKASGNLVEKKIVRKRKPKTKGALCLPLVLREQTRR